MPYDNELCICVFVSGTCVQLLIKREKKCGVSRVKLGHRLHMGRNVTKLKYDSPAPKYTIYYILCERFVFSCKDTSSPNREILLHWNSHSKTLQSKSSIALRKIPLFHP